MKKNSIFWQKFIEISNEFNKLARMDRYQMCDQTIKQQQISLQKKKNY